jgi:hypothetical protein
VLEAVDAEIREHLERIRTLDVHVGHVMRLIEERTRFTPRSLFVSPVRELVANDRKRVRTDL